MLKALLILAATGGTELPPSPPAQGGVYPFSVPCSSTAELLSLLTFKYSEALAGRGVTGDGSLIELFASKTGSFTVVMRNASGAACVLAVGQDWQR